MKYLICALALLPALSFAEPQLVIMRHGQADHNVQKFHSSNPSHANYRPSYLTVWGRTQALIGAWMLRARGINASNVQLALVSPLPRTLQTLGVLIEQGVVSANRVVIEPRLIEAQKGRYEGCSHSLNKVLMDPARRAEAGLETNSEIHGRMASLLADLLSVSATQNVICVTHGHPAEALYEQLSGMTCNMPTAGFKVVPLTSEATQGSKAILRSCRNLEADTETERSSS